MQRQGRERTTPKWKLRPKPKPKPALTLSCLSSFPVTHTSQGLANSRKSAVERSIHTAVLAYTVPYTCTHTLGEARMQACRSAKSVECGLSFCLSVKGHSFLLLLALEAGCESLNPIVILSQGEQAIDRAQSDPSARCRSHGVSSSFDPAIPQSHTGAPSLRH